MILVNGGILNCVGGGGRSKERRMWQIAPASPYERVQGPQVGGKHVYSGNQVRKEGGNQYLDMVSAIESEVAELHSSTATGAPL